MKKSVSMMDSVMYLNGIFILNMKIDYEWMVNGVNKEATLFGNCKNEKVVSVCCSARSTPVV